MRPTILFLKGSTNFKFSLSKNLESAELIHSKCSRSNTENTEMCKARIINQSKLYQSLPEVALDSPNSRRSQNYHQIFTIPNQTSSDLLTSSQTSHSYMHFKPQKPHPRATKRNPRIKTRARAHKHTHTNKQTTEAICDPKM